MSIDQRPRLSIGLPVRNGESTIQRTIDSLLAQTFTDFELIVVDNCSTDETLHIVERHQQQDSRVTLHKNETNIGQMANFDKALSLATSEYFMWASSDDFWHEDFASTLIDRLDSDATADAAVSFVKRVTPDGDEINTAQFPLIADGKSTRRIDIAIAIAAGYSNKQRYHLLFYSIYRTKFVQKGLPYASVSTVYPDRTFMSQFVLGGNFVRVDRPLMLKTLDPTPMQHRYAGEAYASALGEDPWKFIKASWAVVPTIIRSSVVPWWRKGFAPIVFAASLWGYKYELYTGDSTWRLPIALPLRVARRVARMIMRRNSNRTPPSA